MNHQLQLQTRHEPQGLIDAWLDEKQNRSGSDATLRAYRDTFGSFLAELALFGLAVDGPADQIALIIQSWAGRGRKGRVAASTFNQRLSIVSSFYEYARRHGANDLVNPAERVSRRRGEAENYAEPLAAPEIRARLAAIDRTNLIGKRDYAILIVGLATGRRVSELAGLARCDVQVSGESCTLHFRNMKGGKQRRDLLQPRFAAALRDYMDAAQQALEEADREIADDAPIWIGFSPRDPLAPAGRAAIAGVCERWLHTSQTHTLRHSFALMMKNAGASIYEIQEMLGHANASTTDRYLRTRVQSPANPHADSLADELGL
jgi:integrase/recombinase XerD